MWTGMADKDLLDEVMLCWIMRNVNDSVLLARQINKWFLLSILMGISETHPIPLSKPAICQKIKGIVTTLLATKGVGSRQIGFFQAVISWWIVRWVSAPGRATVLLGIPSRK